MGRDCWRVDYFQSNFAAQYFVTGKIGDAHATATKFP